MNRSGLAVVLLGIGVIGGSARAQTSVEQLVGPGVRLMVDRDVVSGHVNGGAYAVQVESGNAHGRGPLGAIDLRLRKLAQGYGVDGTWNGEPVTFVVTADSIRGSADRPVSDQDRSVERCRYDVETVHGRAAWSGREDCLEVTRPVRFDFRPRSSTSLDDERTAVMLIAYLVAPPVYTPRR